MMLLAVLMLMALLAVAGLTLPLLRPPVLGVRQTTAAVLKRQLEELESGLAGELASEEAKGLGTEIKRRILTETRGAEAPARPFPPPIHAFLAAGTACVMLIAAAALYVRVGRPDLASMPRHPALATAGTNGPLPTGELADIIARVKQRLAASPGDKEGWRVLGWAYLISGRPSDAANSYARAIALDPRNAADLSAQGDALVQAASGQVTPAALVAFRTALVIDPSDPRARYFLGLAKEQQGDHAGAMVDWIALLKSAPPSAPWLPQVRRFVEEDARAHGEVLARELLTAPEPTDAQIAATERLSPGEQRAMIESMVEGLAARLNANPRDLDGWTRLMRARMVLGEKRAAVQAYGAARRAFSNAPGVQEQLHNEARTLGVPGA